MNAFWIRSISAIAIVVSIFTYNNILENRVQAEKIAYLEHQLEYNYVIDNSDSAKIENNYKDGEYEGEANGFGGSIKVKILISNGAIDSIKILSAENEDKAYFSMAEKIVDEMIQKQTYNVDTVSGATFSSTGIKNAVAQALGKAV